jgi:hypothetical protein
MFVTICWGRGPGGGPDFYPYTWTLLLDRVSQNNRWGICANSFDKQSKVTIKPDFYGKIPS